MEQERNSMYEKLQQMQTQVTVMKQNYIALEKRLTQKVEQEKTEYHTTVIVFLYIL